MRRVAVISTGLHERSRLGLPTQPVSARSSVWRKERRLVSYLRSLELPPSASPTAIPPSSPSQAFYRRLHTHRLARARPRTARQLLPSAVLSSCHPACRLPGPASWHGLPHQKHTTQSTTTCSIRPRTLVRLPHAHARVKLVLCRCLRCSPAFRRPHAAVSPERTSKQHPRAALRARKVTTRQAHHTRPSHPHRKSPCAFAVNDGGCSSPEFPEPMEWI